MLTEYNTQIQLYADFARAFKSNALTGDIVMNRNEMAVRESLINMLFTNPGERFYSDFGIGINHYLFEPMGIDTTLEMQDRIQANIKTWEPRCNLINVQVVPDYDGNAYNITITFSLINSVNRQFTLNFLLKRTR